MGLLAEFGGLFAIISKVFALIGLLINERALASSMLKNMYFLKLNDKLDPKEGMWPNLKNLTSHLYEIDFGTMDRFAEVRKGLVTIFCCACSWNAHKKHINRREKLFLKGFYKI